MSLARIALLGRFTAWSDDGTELDVGPPRQQAVLATLAMRPNTPVAASELLAAVWGEHAPGSGEQVVHTYMHRLRRLVEPAARRGQYRLIVHQGSGYALRLPVDRLDTREFDELAERGLRLASAGDQLAASRLLGAALALWRGEPFAGLPGPFLAAHRTRLAERRLALWQERMEVDLRLGNASVVLPDLIALAAEHPLNERIAGLLMTAYVQCGRQGEAIAAFLLLRRRLVDELGVEPGAGLRARYTELLRGTDTGPARPSAAVVTTTTALPPRQLPSDAAHFVGRAAELAALPAPFNGLSRTTPDDPAAVGVIYGRPGVGKSTLALHAAHRARTHFPDGQLYLDLRGTEAEPSRPEQALIHFLRMLGVPARQIPATLDERAALFQKLLAGRRVAIVLDDARDEQQVRPLLPGTPGSAALVTSRKALVGLTGATAMRLDSLQAQESVLLLRRMVGAGRIDAEADAAARIAEFCAHLPLALAITAGRLIARPHWSVRQLAERLRDRRDRLDELSVAGQAVRERVALSLRLLSAEHRRALRLLSRLDQPVIDLAVAEGELGTGRRTARWMIDVLVDHQLLDVAGVDPSGAPRFRFHELIRLCARESADEPSARLGTTAGVAPVAPT